MVPWAEHLPGVPAARFPAAGRQGAAAAFAPARCGAETTLLVLTGGGNRGGRDSEDVCATNKTNHLGMIRSLPVNGFIKKPLLVLKYKYVLPG